MTDFSRRDLVEGGMALPRGTLVRPQYWFRVTPLWGPRDWTERASVPLVGEHRQRVEFDPLLV